MLLGVDVINDGKLVSKDLNGAKIPEILDSFNEARTVLSPIGGQGFIFGRGN